MLPLHGIRIIDLSRALAGPYCTALLGDLGAEIIKVESIHGGDSSRSWPPFEGARSLYFDSTNRNKQSLALDLYSDAGKEVLARLLAGADALVENFKPGTMEKMGLAPERLRAINPELVTASITGYGDAGPLRDRPGLDQVLQAVSGLTSVTGRDAENTFRVGVPIIDISSGMVAALGLVTALLGRHRGQEPNRVSTSLFETALGLSAFQGQRAISLSEAPAPQANNHPTITPYGVYRTATESMVVAVGTETQWQAFCRQIGNAALADDPRFATSRDRTANRESLNAIVNDALETRPAGLWIEGLSAAGIPCGPINDYVQAIGSEQSKALGMVQEARRADGSEVRLLRGPLTIDAEPTPVTSAPPALGEHTERILASLGYDRSDIAALTEASVVRQSGAVLAGAAGGAL
jgi:crotonobetainyl-CoA:carnitine CoA-transferase CaiB-like acyl-CoA transferase